MGVKLNMAKKSASGSGSLRKKTVTRKGQEYTYWEGRVTVGTDPGTGKPIRRSFTGKTQKEVREKMQAAAVEVNTGIYTDPSRITVGEWLDIWMAEYLGGVKEHTVSAYKGQIRHHIKPVLGAVRLEALTAPMIQGFYNSLTEKGLSPKTVKNIHGIFHEALQKAVKVHYIRFNPSDACELPRVVKKELKPLDEEETRLFLEAIKGHRFEALFTVTLFTGMREGEIMGLTWDSVNFTKGVILIRQQLHKSKETGEYSFTTLKNDKHRTITPAPWVMQLLKQHRAEQSKLHLKAGAAWENSNLVFTDELGRHLAFPTVYGSFKRVAASIGRPDLRFHDLRHSYAVAAIRSGDDIKTVQGNLGHATAAFTLDVYGHLTDQMKQASAERMECYIKDVLNL